MLRLLLASAFALVIITACGAGDDSPQSTPTVRATAIAASNTATPNAATKAPTDSSPPPFTNLPDACRVSIAAWEDFPNSDGWPGGFDCENLLGLSLAGTRAHYERVGDSDYFWAKEFWAEDY